MDRIKKDFIIILVTLTGLLFAFGSLFPQIFINSTVHLWANISLLFFLLIELTIIFIIFKNDKSENPRQQVNIFMAMKVGKILLSICFIMIYVLAIKTETKHFLIVFAILYLIYLIFDTVFLLKKININKTTN